MVRIRERLGLGLRLNKVYESKFRFRRQKTKWLGLEKPKLGLNNVKILRLGLGIRIK